MSSGQSRRREDTLRGIAGWWLQPARRGWIAVLFLVLVVSVSVAAALYSGNRDRLIRDEGQTCKIQSRGLRANTYLVRVVGDLHTLVEGPISPAQKHRLAKLPNGSAILAAYLDLNASAFNYTWVQRQQPQHRNC